LGLTGTALIACLLFNESMPLQKLLSIMIIISGLILIEKGTSIGGE
jgi:multidrug transporter EmrE-like cation transporter